MNTTTKKILKNLVIVILFAFIHALTFITNNGKNTSDIIEAYRRWSEKRQTIKLSNINIAKNAAVAA